jgi:hypothetical protein
MVVDTLVSTFGPFLIPVALFVLGFVGYLCLVVVNRLRADGSERASGDE